MLQNSRRSLGASRTSRLKLRREYAAAGAMLVRPAAEKVPLPPPPRTKIPIYAEQMAAFMRRRVPKTVLPPPNPGTTSSLSYQKDMEFVNLKEARAKVEYGERVNQQALTEQRAKVNGELDALRNTWHKDSPAMDLLSVVDACLHNLYDVPRAKSIFDKMRTARSNVLERGVYNKVLESYLGMAKDPNIKASQNAATSSTTTSDVKTPEYWLGELWSLYWAMEDGTEASNVEPDSLTYALAWLALTKFPNYPSASQLEPFKSQLAPEHLLPSSPSTSSSAITEDKGKQKEADSDLRTKVPTAQQLLLASLDRSIDAIEIVASRVMGGVSPSDTLGGEPKVEESERKEAGEDAAYSAADGVAVIKRISRTAVDMGRMDVVSHIGQAESLARTGIQTLTRHLPDALEGVPEVRPVVKPVPITRKDDGGAREDGKEEEVEMQVPFNLDNLRKHLAGATLSRRVLPEDVAARQKLLEESMHDVALTRLRHEAETMAQLGTGHVSRLNKRMDLQTYMWNWHLKLTERLKVEIKNIQARENEPRSGRRIPKDALYRPSATSARAEDVSPYLNLLKADKLSLLVIMEVMRLAGAGGISDGMKTARALLTVGRAVENEYKAKVCKSSNIRLVVPATGSPSGGPNARGNPFFTSFGYRNLQERRVTAAKLMTDGEDWVADWTQVLRAKVGGVLVDCLVEVCTVTRTAVDKRTGNVVTEEQPAFLHSYEYLRGQKLGVISLNPVIAERLAIDSLGATVQPRHLPMLVKPKPWLAPDNGGYLFSRSPVMRFKESAEQESYLKRASELGNVELVYAGLDVLGSTPWQINREVFNVVLKQWNSGKRLGKMPPAVFDEPEPTIEDIMKEEQEAAAAGRKERKSNYFETVTGTAPLSSELPKSGPSRTAFEMKGGSEMEGMDNRIRTKHQIRLTRHRNNKANNHSDRCSVNYKVEIARAFLGDTFYQPHNLDFRGRAYPIPPHLNHIGDDLSRGLLRFAEGKPLGERGLRWLKIHLANLYGFDKASFDERVQWTQDRLDDVYDSAMHPLDGRGFWTKADDPWQFLAACFELRNALESPDPLLFVSHLPVHQDGTCNGLQHYAALGGDTQGAAQVNLSPGERPSDVYTYVGNMVERQIDSDAANGDKNAQLLQGKITRKVVKQTVMTTVYGVTFIGAREQIERQLRDRGDIPAELSWGASIYLAHVVLSSIGNLFNGANHIMNWLSIAARLISKSIPAERLPEALAEFQLTKQGKAEKILPLDWLRKEQMTSVVWTTPLGLPVVQPYRKLSKKQIHTALQTIFISDPNSPAEVNALKQASAFPPNFIHSLDATHMMLTALECRAQNITFASVHDSYWSHASSIDDMSEVIRETFVALHSSEILQKLRTEFIERYQNYRVPLLQMSGAPKFLKAMIDTGVKITVTPEEAKMYRFLKPLLRVSKTEPSMIIDECAGESGQALVGLENVEEDTSLDTSSGEAAEDSITDMEDNEEEELELEDDASDEESPTRRRRGMGKKGLESILIGKFIRMVDLVPPLPPKGDFAVELIKASPYFFS